MMSLLAMPPGDMSWDVALLLVVGPGLIGVEIEAAILLVVGPGLVGDCVVVEVTVEGWQLSFLFLLPAFLYLLSTFLFLLPAFLFLLSAFLLLPPSFLDFLVALLEVEALAFSFLFLQNSKLTKIIQ
jgi:hypothetical protein